MNQQAFRKLFSNTPGRLGDALTAAKTGTDNKDVRRTWVLFGDPTMLFK